MRFCKLGGINLVLSIPSIVDTLIWVFFPFLSYIPLLVLIFRADTKRREPWVFGEPYTSLIRSAIRTRYALLPYWYTLFYVNNQTGAPLLRPLWVEFPTDESTFCIHYLYVFL